jgi:hypothetical protein
LSNAKPTIPANAMGFAALNPSYELKLSTITDAIFEMASRRCAR